jgi:hypothetical protein
VYAAAVEVARQPGYAIRAAFPEAHFVSFTTGRLRKRRHDLRVTAIQASDRVTRVVVGVDPAAGYSSFAARHLTECDEVRKLSLLCLRQIQRALRVESIVSTENVTPCPWCDDLAPSRGAPTGRTGREDRDATTIGDTADAEVQRLLHENQLHHRYHESCRSFVYAIKTTRDYLLRGTLEEGAGQ